MAAPNNNAPPIENAPPSQPGKPSKRGRGRPRLLNPKRSLPEHLHTRKREYGRKQKPEKFNRNIVSVTELMPLAHFMPDFWIPFVLRLIMFHSVKISCRWCLQSILKSQALEEVTSLKPTSNAHSSTSTVLRSSPLRAPFRSSFSGSTSNVVSSASTIPSS